MSSEGSVHLRIEGAVASVTFDRPEARNAMTWAMYEALARLCEQLRGDASVRVVRLRGAGGQAFVAGTDIAQFQDFRSGDDGVAYERRIDACVGAARIAADADAGRARGLGHRRRAGARHRLRLPHRHAGHAARRADRAHARQLPVGGQRRAPGRRRSAGRAPSACCCWPSCSPPRRRWPPASCWRSPTPDAIDAASDTLCRRLAALAPLTQRASKETLNRLLHAHLPDIDDLVRACYGSADFREGVQAFVGKRPPVWSGR